MVSNKRFQDSLARIRARTDVVKAVIGEADGAPAPQAPRPVGPTPPTPRATGNNLANHVVTTRKGSDNSDGMRPHPIGSWVRLRSTATVGGQRSQSLSEPHLVTGHRIQEHAFRADQHSQHYADPDGFTRHKTQGYAVINPSTNKYRVVSHHDVVPHQMKP